MPSPEEKIRDVDDSVIDYVCSNYEKEYVFHSKDKCKAFFEIFCLKEAYLKIKGNTILNISDINFLMDNNHFICKQDNNININLDYSLDNYIIAIIGEKD